MLDQFLQLFLKLNPLKDKLNKKQNLKTLSVSDGKKDYEMVVTYIVKNEWNLGPTSVIRKTMAISTTFWSLLKSSAHQLIWASPHVLWSPIAQLELCYLLSQ